MAVVDRVEEFSKIDVHDPAASQGHRGSSWQALRSALVLCTRSQISAYLSCFPQAVHKTAPPSLRGVPSGWFPRLIGTMRRSDFLTVFSPHFVSFAWRYLGAPAFRPRSAADAWPTDHPGVCCTGCSRSGFLQGTARFSHVPVKPVRSFAMFLRPRCDLARLWVQV